MTDRAIRRKQSWMRSQSEGFGPIKQVGIASSIGFPLLVVGALMLVIAFTAVGSWLWIVAGALVALGLLAGLSHRII